MLNGNGKEEEKGEAVAAPNALAPKANEPGFQFQFHGQLLAWLEANQVSVGFTTYQIGKVFLVGRNPNQPRLSIYERTFAESMGLASSADGQQLAMGSLYQIWRFSNAVREPQQGMPYDKVYIPQVGYTTGSCDAHDLGFDKKGKIVFANTMFNCIATMSETQSFVPIWKPPFISNLAPEDRCHLNGLGFRDGEPRYVTACSQTDTKAGWREHRQKGGVVMDIKTNEVLCEGLSMPHSPRWHQDKLWVLNSGEGEFGTVDMKTRQFKRMAFCQGFARGLSFHNNVAVIGLSKPRHNDTFEGLGLEQKLQQQKTKASVGLQLVDINTGQTLLAFWIGGDIKEIYDVTIMPNTRTPMLLGFRNEEIQHTIAFDESALNQLKQEEKEEAEVKKLFNISPKASPSSPVSAKKEEKSEEEVMQAPILLSESVKPAVQGKLQEKPNSESTSSPSNLAQKPGDEKKPLLSTTTIQRLRALALFGAFASAAVATGAFLASKSINDAELEETADPNMLTGCSIM
jgi:uncharacterized protein (TIGR03032 family)